MGSRRGFAPVIIVLLIGSLLATFAPQVLAAQTPQVLKFGVIGPVDGPTAQGVALAVERINKRGPINGPGGATYTLAISAINANSADEVARAVTSLKGDNAVAIFGPDDNNLVQASDASLRAAGVPVFTGATSTAIKPGGNVFRTRAADNWQTAALAEVLVKDLTKNSFAIYQGDESVGSAVTEMVTALTQRGKAPAPPIIQVASGAIADSAKVLQQSSPEVIIAFGNPGQVAELYRTLRAANYAGTFATPVADDRLFINALPPELRSGIYGVTTWPYSWDAADSSTFTRDYVALFGVVPTALSAGAYDAAVATAISLGTAGPAPDALRTAILNLPTANSLQGTFNPKLGNNELSSSVAVTVTGPYGAPTLVARFVDGKRVQLTDVPPTPTLRPPTLTPIPSATPDGVTCTTKGTSNVRTGPGTGYGVIGQLRASEQVQLIGANADFTWYVINFRQQQGWISATLCNVFGNTRTLPLIAPPPTPIPTSTPLATATFTAVPISDITFVSAVMSPPVPVPGAPMTLNVTLRNNGGVNAGEFAVATSFKPGEVYTAAIVPGLAAGQQATVALSNTVTGTGVFTIAIIIDLNNQVNEGAAGEANNKPEFSYRVDRPRIANGSVNVGVGSSVDFQGGTQDLSYDGTKIVPINGAKLGALPGTPVDQVHWDFLSADKINNVAGIARADLVPGLVIGIYTAENKRGALRVSGYSGDTLILEFFVYDQ